MSDIQQTVDDLQTAISAPGNFSDEALRQLLADFSAACTDANERLRACGKLLKQGLRSEAIQIAEHDPNLLDVVAMLDFPEAVNLPYLAQKLRLVTPPSLQIDVAAELNEAYSLHQPLEHLLGMHRLLALARGPLDHRLATLRKIAAVDVKNTVWLDDIQEFERERLKEINDRAHGASRTRDVATLAALQQELAAPGWQTLPPKPLIRFISGTIDKLRVDEARLELEQIEPKLNECFAAFDVDQARNWRDAWEKAAAVCMIENTDSIAERAAPALSWLSDQDEKSRINSEHQVAVATLEQALDGDTSAVELERMEHAALRHELDIPVYVAQRLEARKANLQLAASRKSRLILAASITAVLLCGVMLVGLISWRSHLGEVASRAAALEGLLKQETLGEARQLLDQIERNNPRVRGAAEIEKHALVLQGMEKSELQRQERFEALIAQARTAGPETPDRDALKQAREIAASDDEKSQIADIELVIARTQREMLKTRDERFSVELKAFLDATQKLAGDDTHDVRSTRAEINEIEAGLNALLARSGLVSSVLREQSRPITAKLSALKQAVNQREQEQSILALISKAVGNLDEFSRLLKAYASQFPDTGRSQDFLRVAQESELWSGMLEWNQFMRAFRAAGVGGLSPGEIDKLVVIGMPLVEKYGGFPMASTFNEQTRLWQVLKQRIDEEGKPIIGKLEQLFNSRLMSNIWMVEIKGGKGTRRLYFDQQPPPFAPGTQPKVRYLVGFDFSTKQVQPVPQGDTISFQGLAPQAELSVSALTLLKQTTDANWDATMSQLVTRLMQHKGIDPLLRMTILKRVLDTACRGSKVLQEEYRSHRDALDDTAVNMLANWMDPADEDFKKAGQDAERELKQSHKLEVFEAIAAKLSNPPHLVPPDFSIEYQWVGWAQRDAGRNWQCTGSRLQRESGELVCLSGDKATRVELQHVGRVQNGNVQIDASASIIEGRPLWFVAPPAPAASPVSVTSREGAR